MGESNNKGKLKLDIVILLARHKVCFNSMIFIFRINLVYRLRTETYLLIC